MLSYACSQTRSQIRTLLSSRRDRHGSSRVSTKAPPLWDEMGLPASGKSHESPKFLHTRTSEIAGATSRLFRAMSAWTYIYWELCISFSTQVQT